jgi:hypothetical protein
MRRLSLILRKHSSRFGAASPIKPYFLLCQRVLTGCCFASNAASKAARSFWFLGVITNASWFLMLAVATNISAGGVALVVSTHIQRLLCATLGCQITHILRYIMYKSVRCQHASGTHSIHISSLLVSFGIIQNPHING